MKSMFDLKIMTISIQATEEINFKEVDDRIRSNPWAESYPASTTISFPETCVKDVMAKLKITKNVTSVNGELTEFGKQVHAEMASQSRAMFR